MSVVSRLSEQLSRMWPTLILGAVLGVLMFNGLMGPRGPADLLVLRHRRAQLEARRTALLEQKRGLETSVQNIRSNDGFIEHLIRRELGYARPDELVYKFTGSNTQP